VGPDTNDDQPARAPPLQRRRQLRPKRRRRVQPPRAPAVLLLLLLIFRAPRLGRRVCSFLRLAGGFLLAPLQLCCQLGRRGGQGGRRRVLAGRAAAAAAAVGGGGGGGVRVLFRLEGAVALGEDALGVLVSGFGGLGLCRVGGGWVCVELGEGWWGKSA
jgi:hypothetical protein